MTPLQARRLHVLRSNQRALHIGDRRPRVDWVVLAVWIGLLLSSVLVTGVVFVLVVTLFRWVRGLLG